MHCLMQSSVTCKHCGSRAAEVVLDVMTVISVFTPDWGTSLSSKSSTPSKAAPVTADSIEWLSSKDTIACKQALGRSQSVRRYRQTVPIPSLDSAGPSCAVVILLTALQKSCKFQGTDGRSKTWRWAPCPGQRPWLRTRRGKQSRVAYLDRRRLLAVGLPIRYLTHTQMQSLLPLLRCECQLNGDERQVDLEPFKAVAM